MKVLPICKICLESGFLCQACEKKVKKGEISERDVEIARLLYRLYKKDLVINPSFKKSVETDGYIILLVEGPVAPLIGKGGRVVRLLSKELGKKVRVVDISSGIKKMIEDLVLPARLYGISVVYKPDGNEEYRILLKRNEKRQIPDEILCKIVEKVSGKSCSVTYL